MPTRLGDGQEPGVAAMNAIGLAHRLALQKADIQV